MSHQLLSWFTTRTTSMSCFPSSPHSTVISFISQARDDRQRKQLLWQFPSPDNLNWNLGWRLQFRYFTKNCKDSWSVLLNILIIWGSVLIRTVKIRESVFIKTIMMSGLKIIVSLWCQLPKMVRRFWVNLAIGDHFYWWF